LLSKLFRFESETNFHFRGPSLGYFKLGVLPEGLRRLMANKSALHVLVTLTEQVVPLHKHIILFWILSISGTKTVTMKLMKKPCGEVIWPHTHGIFIEYLADLV